MPLTQELDLRQATGTNSNTFHWKCWPVKRDYRLAHPPGGWQIRVSTGLPQPFLKYLEPQLAQIPEYEDPEDSELFIINQLLNTFTQAVSLGRLSSVGSTPDHRATGFRGHFRFSVNTQNFPANDKKLLSSFANQTAIAVQNAQLYAQVE